MGIPFRQMHSWDYSGPYHGYDGFAIFARDMDMTINNPCWKELQAPWLRTDTAAEGPERAGPEGNAVTPLPGRVSQKPVAGSAAF